VKIYAPKEGFGVFGGALPGTFYRREALLPDSISTVSQTPGTLELRELTLAIETSKGLIAVAGCSHPGIEKIVEALMPIDKHVHLIFGGLHLVTTPEPEILRVATTLHDQWKVDRMAPGHCTGEPTFAALQKAFGDQYLYVGLGSVIDLLSHRMATRS
jgi:7,8-dihydropterin-6-yl-methyl-4-(beta-D-ribofuranosyl)aminobenzene 5'-phosphate synthase